MRSGEPIATPREAHATLERERERLGNRELTLNSALCGCRTGGDLLRRAFIDEVAAQRLVLALFTVVRALE